MSDTRVTYDTSTDYKQLWKHIQQGEIIAGWLTYSADYDPPIRDIVEIKKSESSGNYMIGTRGRGYEDFSQTESSFIETCTNYDLEFVTPSILTDEGGAG